MTHTAPAIDSDLIGDLYGTYADALKRVRDQQRRLVTERAGRMRFQLDDLEAEITYLLIREFEPDRVAEIGALDGWSTSWLLSALRDNEHGHLTSYDRVDGAIGNIPPGLSRGRWTFVSGDAREHADELSTPDYLFIDAAHSARFARWYLREVFPNIAPGTPVSVHDVFHGRIPLPFSEGRVVCRYLAAADTNFLTASPARDRTTYEFLLKRRREVGITEPIRPGTRNPMIFFRRP